jgi:hypothetical protein
MFVAVTTGGRWRSYYKLVGRDQGCCWISFNAHNSSPTNKKLPSWKCAEMRKPWLIPLITTHMNIYTHACVHAWMNTHMHIKHVHMYTAHSQSSALMEGAWVRAKMKSCWGDPYRLWWDTLCVGISPFPPHRPRTDCRHHLISCLGPSGTQANLTAYGVSLSHILCRRIELHGQQLWHWDCSRLVCSGLDLHLL